MSRSRPRDARAAPEVRRERATVLFADLLGFAAISERAGPERAYELMTRGLTLLDGVARRHGGAVDKYLGDALMAVFGHPIAVADPERRALGAAHEMRQMVHDFRDGLADALPVDVKVGLNTGEIVFGEVGDVRREFSILGDPVNVAARLKSKAGAGEIYVGAETRAAGGDGFGFRDLEPLALKGKAKRIPASELVERRDDPTRVAGDALEEAGFVGRVEERAQLGSDARVVARGQGGVRAIVGAAGIGKSRLVAEAAREATALPLLWRVARARPGGDSLEPFAPLVRHFAGIGDDAPGRVVRLRLRETLARHLPSAEPDRSVACLLRVLGRRTRGGEGRFFEGISADAFQALLVESVAAVVEALARRNPLILVLEDWQWADAASRRLTGVLARRAAKLPLAVWVVGRALDELPAASRAAISLEPLSPDAARALCDGLAEAQALPEPLRKLVTEHGRGNPMETVLAAFLAPALAADARRAREDTHRERETERRRATVLFADLSGFTSLSERAPVSVVYAAVTACLERLHQIALEHGGSVDKHMGDCVMAVFGYPEAIEDTPRTAVNAAIEMRREVEAFNAAADLPSDLELHCGIETGLSIAGALESWVVGEFALLGDAAKAADEITHLAGPGEIFVGAETRRSTEDVFDYAPRASYRLEGQQAELASFEMLSRSPRHRRRRAAPGAGLGSQLVGRETELRRIEEALAALSAGRGGVVSVLGEAGIGKSRLLVELRERFADGGFRWLESRSLSIGRSLPFHTFTALLAAWVGREPDADEGRSAERWWEATRALLGERAEEVTPYLLQVAALPLSEGHRARLDDLPGDALQRLVVRAFTELLRGLGAERPLVLVFDDLHGADLASIELLEAMLRLAAESPILFVTLSRMHYAETSDRILETARTEHAERHLELQLEPLGPEACRELIRNLFRGADVPVRLRSTLEEKAAGNPLFVEEVVRSLLADGSLVVEAGKLRATERIRDAEVPGNIQEVVLARIDRLPATPRRVLQVASALGRAFRADVLSEVLEEPDPSAELETLVEADLLVRGPGAGVEHEFKHPLIQETAYDSILHARREVLHRRIGAAIETRLSPTAPGYDAILAYHFGRGRDSERAEKHLFRAGDAAARSSASNEALRFFEEASRLYLELHGQDGDPRKMATLEASIARAYSNRGQLLEAVSHFDEALRRLGERVPGDREILFRIGPLLLGVLARLYWPGHSRRAADPRRREVIELMYGRAQAQPTTSPVRFVFDTMHNLWKLQHVDPRTIENAGAMYASTVGTFAFGGVSFAISRRFLAEAEPLVGSGDARERLIFEFMRFLHHFLEGDWADERGVAEPLIEEGIRIGALWEVSNFLDLDTERCIAQGRFERARGQLATLARIADLFHYDLARASHEGLSAFLLLEERKLEQTVQTCDRYFEEYEEDSFRVMALASRAKAQALQGRTDEADATLQRAATLIEHSGSLLPFHQSSYLRSRALTDLVRLEARDGGANRSQRRAARRSIGRAVRMASRVASRRPEVFRLAGRYQWLTGHPRRARRFWARSLEASARLGTRPEKARVELEIAARLATRPGETGPDGRSADALLDSAAAEFRSLGLEVDLADADRVRESLA